MRNRPRQQHYVPRFYLDGFSDPVLKKREGKSVLWVYTKGRPIRKSTPTSEAKSRDFYTAASLGSEHETQVEDWLGLIESNAARILYDSSFSSGTLEGEDRKWLALFAGTLFTRTPLGRRILDDVSGPAAIRLCMEAAKSPDNFRELIFGVTPPEELVQLDIEEIRRQVLTGRASVISNSPQMSLASLMSVGQKCAGLLHDMAWQFVFAHEEELFVTSDNPVTSIVWHPDGTSSFRAGFGQPGANVYLPLSRDVCLRMVNDVAPGTYIIVDRGVRQINKLVMGCADKYLYAAESSESLRSAFERHGSQAPAESFQPKWNDEPI